MSGKMKIGYVGVGLMGLPMAKRLLSLGYTVRAYDIAPQCIAAARDAGAAAASSAADAVRGSDLVLLNLPTPEAVEAAVFGENGVETSLPTVSEEKLSTVVGGESGPKLPRNLCD